jgi:hypothetical protein
LDYYNGGGRTAGNHNQVLRISFTTPSTVTMLRTRISRTSWVRNRPIPIIAAWKLDGLIEHWPTGHACDEWIPSPGPKSWALKSANCAGIVIPYFLPGSERIRQYRLHLDRPGLNYESTGDLPPGQIYLSQPVCCNMLFLPPGTSESLLADTGLPILLTEGEFRALALWRLANYGSPRQPRFLPLAVSGIHNWRGTFGRTVGPDDSLLHVKREINDLDGIMWDRRHVVIAYDAEAVAREGVSALPAHNWPHSCAFGVLWWASWSGTRPRAKASMITSPLLVFRS